MKSNGMLCTIWPYNKLTGRSLRKSGFDGPESNSCEEALSLSKNRPLLRKMYTYYLLSHRIPVPILEPLF